jgi:endonuclease/exonuclease/phosphatase family metal-dependent hydrolase
VLEQRLDYILTDPGWKLRSARVLDDGPSDHRPVLAELVHP